MGTGEVAGALPRARPVDVERGGWIRGEPEESNPQNFPGGCRGGRHLWWFPSF